MTDFQFQADSFAQTYPKLYDLGMWSKERVVVSKNKQRTKFNIQQTEELKRFMEDSNNEQEITKKYLLIEKMFGPSFKKACRDKYNTYIKPAMFVFTKEIDSRILFLHFSGVDYKTISQEIGCGAAKTVQNHIAKLLSKKSISQNPNISLMKVYVESMKMNHPTVQPRQPTPPALIPPYPPLETPQIEQHANPVDQLIFGIEDFGNTDNVSFTDWGDFVNQEVPPDYI